MGSSGLRRRYLEIRALAGLAVLSGNLVLQGLVRASFLLRRRKNTDFHCKFLPAMTFPGIKGTILLWMDVGSNIFPY